MACAAILATCLALQSTSRQFALVGLINNQPKFLLTVKYSFTESCNNMVLGDVV